MTNPVRRPKIVAITNENPDWPEADKQEADGAWNVLLTGLEQEGYTCRAFKFFDDLTFLDDFDPREWLVWNWGEELAGRRWSDAEVADEIEQRGFRVHGRLRGPHPPGARPHARQTASASRGHCPRCQPSSCAILRPPRKWTTYPAIVKGNNQHASVGIDGDSVVHTTEQLARRVRYLRQTYGDDALVEPFLDTQRVPGGCVGKRLSEALRLRKSSTPVFPTFVTACTPKNGKPFERRAATKES